MDVKLAVLADFASITREGKLNILGIFDQINPPVLPFRSPQMFLVSSISAEPTEIGREFQFEILLWDSDGNEVLAIEQPIQFAQPDRPGGQATTNVIIGLSNVPFERAADYVFYIRIGGEQRRRINLRVNEPRGESQS